MKSANKIESKKKGLKKLNPKVKLQNKLNKDSIKNPRVDTDFHHEHPFKEN